MRILLVALLSVSLLTSCIYINKTVSLVTGEDYEEARYNLGLDNYPVTSLDVQELEVVNTYVMPMREPNVEHLFPVSLYGSLERMFRTKLLPLGREDILRVTVEEASVISEPLPIDVSIWGNFKKEPIERLNARVKVRMKLIDGRNPGVVLSYADVVSQRTKVLYEGASVEELDQVYFELTKELVEDINRGMRSNISKYFGDRSFSIITPK